jgi:hypothetical protein
MNIEASSDKHNQKYVLTEYDQNKNQCFHTTVPTEAGGVYVFRIPDGHSIRVYFNKKNPYEPTANVEMNMVNVDGNLNTSLKTQWRCNGVAGQFADLFLDKMHNGISFEVYNAKAMVFAVLPLQFGRAAGAMAMVHPSALAENRASFLRSAMESDGCNITLQQVAMQTDKKCKEVVVGIHARIFKYYSEGKLTLCQWKDIQQLLV